MALDFPSPATPGQVYTAAGKSWVYDASFGWLSTQSSNPAAQYIAKVVCVGGETSITFDNIPQNYTDLEFSYSLRDTAAGSALLGLNCQINGDATAGNYTNEQFLDGFATTAVASTDAPASTGNVCGLLAGTSGLATAMGDGSVTIANYSRSTFHKVVRGVAMGYYSGPTIRERVCSFVWKNTAPVTKAVFTTAGTSFVAGSVITCYGKGAVATSPAVYESSTAPGTPYAGMLWWKSDEGTLKIYYNGAWIDAVAASGGMAKIAKVVCVGGETAIDFASIPQIYTDLELVWSARDTAAGTSTSGTRLKMNGDANAANYASSARSGTASGSFVGNTVPASVLGSLFAFHDNDGNAAGVFAGGSLLIPNYTSIAMLKRFIGSFGQTDAGNGECVFTQSGRWLSLNAVNRLTIGTDGTGFKAGSAFTLYGRG